MRMRARRDEVSCLFEHPHLSKNIAKEAECSTIQIVEHPALSRRVINRDFLTLEITDFQCLIPIFGEEYHR